MATVAILTFSTPQKQPHTTVNIPTKFHEIGIGRANFAAVAMEIKKREIFKIF
jgi:hypothetical protein